MKRLLFIVLLCLNCKGVSVPEYIYHVSNSGYVIDIPVYIDEGFSISERSEINLSLDIWNNSLNGYIRFRVLEWKDWREKYLFITKIDSGSSLVPKQRAGRWTLAWADGLERRTIFVVRERVLLEDLYKIMLHEIGHFLGADHVDRMSLMYPDYDRVKYQCIDLLTIRQVARKYRLPIDGLNYCVY